MTAPRRPLVLQAAPSNARRRCAGCGVSVPLAVAVRDTTPVLVAGVPVPSTARGRYRCKPCARKAALAAYLSTDAPSRS